MAYFHSFRCTGAKHLHPCSGLHKNVDLDLPHAWTQLKYFPFDGLELYFSTFIYIAFIGFHLGKKKLFCGTYGAHRTDRWQV